MQVNGFPYFICAKPPVSTNVDFALTKFIKTEVLDEKPERRATASSSTGSLNGSILASPRIVFDYMTLPEEPNHLLKFDNDDSVTIVPHQLPCRDNCN